MDSIWRKSSYSGDNGGECVEVATAGAVLVRDTADRGGPVLTFTTDVMAGVHRGDQVTGQAAASYRQTGHPRAPEGAPSPGRPSLPSLPAVCQLPGNDYQPRVPDVHAATTQARRDPRPWPATATQANPRLIALALPSIPGSVPVARLQVRAALGLHGLGEYADDAEIITSELVTNAVQHACDNGTRRSG